MHKLIFLMATLAAELAVGQEVEFRFHGLKIQVRDIETSKQFYGDVLGLRVSQQDGKLNIMGQAFPIVIEQALFSSPSEYPCRSRTGLALQVDKLLPTIDQLRDKGVFIYDSLLARNGVGISIPFQDPAGNVLNLIEVQIYDPGAIGGLRVYNTGVTVSDLEAAIAFYQDVLGFEDWSRDYLPAALPLKHHDGSFAFMIHVKEGLSANEADFHSTPQMSLVLTTSDIHQAKNYLKGAKVKVIESGSSLICQDPSGNWVEIIGDDQR